jgi:hypothetical protein
MSEIPTSVRSLFLVAGWCPGRQVPVPAEVPENHPAAAILSEFGGLVVGRVGPGEECGSSDVAFGRPWPSEASEIALWSGLLSSPLMYLAVCHNDHQELYIDGDGRYFSLSMIHDAF